MLPGKEFAASCDQVRTLHVCAKKLTAVNLEIYTIIILFGFQLYYENTRRPTSPHRWDISRHCTRIRTHAGTMLFTS